MVFGPKLDTALTVADETSRFSDEQGLTFLEHLAHNLTISVRIADSDRQPNGPLSEQQTRLAMYWINEAIHNVVQLTRVLRLEHKTWTRDETWKWIDVWLGYDHASHYIRWAIHRSIEQTTAE